MSLFPNKHFDQEDIDEFNRQAHFEYDRIRDFLILHYHATTREDSPFWNYCRTMSIPEELQQKINQFKKNGRIYRNSVEMFNDLSWLEVMHGQGIQPRAYHPIVDVMPKDELMKRMAGIKSVIDRSVEVMPSHAEFIAEHCKAEKLMM
jgi:tryptophan halogenase